MTLHGRIEESEPVSPELVLVSSPELARAARERLPAQAPAMAKPEPEHAESATSTWERLPAQAPAVAKPEPEQSELARAVREQLSTAPAFERSKPNDRGVPVHKVSSAPPRPLPPPYPRPDIVQPVAEPEPSHRRSRAVFVVVALVVLAAAGGGTAFAWGHFLSSPKDTRSALLPSEARGSTATRLPTSATSRSKAGKAGTGAFVPGHTWAWSTVKGARAYLVRFVLNGHEVLRKQTAKNRLVLPRGFLYAAGRYRWTVRSVTGPSSHPRYGRPIVDSKFVLTPAAAAQANRA